MKKVLRSYRELLGILWKDAPWIVALTFICAVVIGLRSPLNAWVNQHIFDDGLAVASGEMDFAAFAPFLGLLVVITLLPSLLQDLLVYGLVQSRALLILNTSYKGRMLEKLKKLRYEHMESTESMEIIDKAFNRAVFSARHMFPMYVFNFVMSVVAAGFLLWMFAQVSLWFLPTILVPFALETWWQAKHSYNIYDEMEHYWKRERSYGTLAGFLRNRDHLYEGKLNGASDFLIATYQKRLNARNREYEGFYYKHLKGYFLTGNITKLAVIGNALLLLHLYLQGQATVGTLVALLLVLFGNIFRNLSMTTGFVKWSGYHIQFLDYYNKFFALSEDAESPDCEKPSRFDIEFRDVCFRYPGTERDILKGLSFCIREGERVSVVGENGEGKSTMIKLLLGLFSPDSGEILLGGRPIDAYTRAQRAAIFAPVFQDFVRYSIPLRENIAVGNIALLKDEQAIRSAADKAQASAIGEPDLLLGRDFEGGVDLSGGQWQRIALARAFLGDKPVLILDEPTSQLDPMAESKLYSEFAALTQGKTAIFITHRLASTMITDRILVLSNGRIAQEGTHGALMARDGLYAEMFEAQRKWYRQEGEVSA